MKDKLFGIISIFLIISCQFENKTNTILLENGIEITEEEKVILNGLQPDFQEMFNTFSTRSVSFDGEIFLAEVKSLAISGFPPENIG